MQHKKKGYLYFIPVGLLFIFGGISVLFFYLSVVAPLMNINEVEINRTIETTLTDGSFMSLFVDDVDLTDYEINEVLDGYQLVFYQGENAYRLNVEIVNSSGDKEGFYITRIPPNQSYTFDTYMNVADIHFTEDDTYNVLIASYDDLPGGFGYSVSDFQDAGVKLVIAISTGAIAVVGSISSLIVILVKKGKTQKI